MITKCGYIDRYVQLYKNHFPKDIKINLKSLSIYIIENYPNGGCNYNQLSLKIVALRRSLKGNTEFLIDRDSQNFIPFCLESYPINYYNYFNYDLRKYYSFSENFIINPIITFFNEFNKSLVFNVGNFCRIRTIVQKGLITLMLNYNLIRCTYEINLLKDNIFEILNFKLPFVPTSQELFIDGIIKIIDFKIKRKKLEKDKEITYGTITNFLPFNFDDTIHSNNILSKLLGMNIYKKRLESIKKLITYKFEDLDSLVILKEDILNISCELPINIKRKVLEITSHNNNK